MGDPVSNGTKRLVAIGIGAMLGTIGCCAGGFAFFWFIASEQITVAQNAPDDSVATLPKRRPEKGVDSSVMSEPTPGTVGYREKLFSTVVDQFKREKQMIPSASLMGSGVGDSSVFYLRGGEQYVVAIMQGDANLVSIHDAPSGDLRDTFTTSSESDSKTLHLPAGSYYMKVIAARDWYFAIYERNTN